MTHRNDVSRERDTLGRWRLLAEQRLEHLTELFESGRWRRYHSELTFLENIKEAKIAVETWRALSTPNAVPRKPIQRSASAEQILRRALEPAPVTAPEPVKGSVAAEAEFTASTEQRPAPVIDLLALEKALDIPELALDLSTVENRYPLLRNAM
jgi:uncharacterized repeat protein (TIGR03809 family)